MGMMKRAIRKMGLIGVLAGILAGMMFGIGMHRIAEAHADTRFPETPTNLRVEGVAGSTHNAVTISWDEEDHRHDNNNPGYFVRLYTDLLPAYWGTLSGYDALCLSSENRPPPEGCFRRTVQARSELIGSRYSITISELRPETRYYVHVRGFFGLPVGSISMTRSTLYGATTTFTTTASPGTPGPDTPDPETPTTPEPETPTTPDPETPTTPDPETPTEPDCTYEHRLIGVPGTTGAGYTSQILISSKDANATATIRAFQWNNGQSIDVLDSEGSAIGSSVSLAPAHSVKIFRLEGARGWHTVIVEHPTARAMRRATVAMRLREPDMGVSIILAERIEDCEPMVTTTG